MQENKEIVVKTMFKSYEDKIKAGISWYNFIAGINNIKLAKREIQLLSFINYRGTISSLSSKDEFCKLFKSSSATISNMVSKLTKLKLLVKVQSKIRINPSIKIDFDKRLFVRLYIDIKEVKENQEIQDEN